MTRYHLEVTELNFSGSQMWSSKSGWSMPEDIEVSFLTFSLVSLVMRGKINSYLAFPVTVCDSEWAK